MERFFSNIAFLLLTFLFNGSIISNIGEYPTNILCKRREASMDELEQEALDYFYEELESYYDDEDEQGEIFDGLND